MRLNLIYARAANGVIGCGNALPWHLPEDLAQFKRLTLGWPVLMGRNTWNSLPERFRPLPGRANLVLTRSAEEAEQLRAAGALPFASLDAALAHCATLGAAADEVWVIGGAQVYALALPLAQRVLATEIQHPFEGDAYAPTLGPEWREVARQAQRSASGLAFDFVEYQRRPAAQ